MFQISKPEAFLPTLSIEKTIWLTGLASILIKSIPAINGKTLLNKVVYAEKSAYTTTKYNK